MAKTRVDVTTLLAGAPVLAVFGGVDRHGRVHVAAAVDQLGRVLGTESFAASAAGYRAANDVIIFCNRSGDAAANAVPITAQESPCAVRPSSLEFLIRFSKITRWPPHITTSRR